MIMNVIVKKHDTFSVMLDLKSTDWNGTRSFHASTVELSRICTIWYD